MKHRYLYPLTLFFVKICVCSIAYGQSPPLSSMGRYGKLAQLYTDYITKTNADLASHNERTRQFACDVSANYKGWSRSDFKTLATCQFTSNLFLFLVEMAENAIEMDGGKKFTNNARQAQSALKYLMPDKLTIADSYRLIMSIKNENQDIINAFIQYHRGRNSSNRTEEVHPPASISNRRISPTIIEIFSGTNESNIKVKKGNAISISVTGSIRFGLFAGRGDANGINGFTGYNKISGFRHGALLGRIDNGPWFFIGTNASFIADKDGVLTLIVNDASTDDNEGSFIVEYSINKTSISESTAPPVNTRPSATVPATNYSTKPLTTEPEESEQFGITKEELKRRLDKYNREHPFKSVEDIEKERLTSVKISEQQLKIKKIEAQISTVKRRRDRKELERELAAEKYKLYVLKYNL